MYASTTVSFVVSTKFFIFAFGESPFFGESITIPQHLLDQTCLTECYPQSLSNSSLQNVQLNK
ncbi:hypothetical protein C0J52_12127 [Blattella germanica]|nr:hypothetical protein C0J52_12127 [Blattella germanica]